MRARRPLAMAAAVATTLAVICHSPAARADGQPAVTVSAKQSNWVFRDSSGREVTLRGFNVSGSTKLYENSLLPFRSTADAARSAQAMRDLTGANAIRFLITWEGVNPAPNQIDYAYLDRAIAQISAFTGRGFRVLIDYHQDLYSRYLFNSGSWYTGDGAPKWVIDAGGYPAESCGICFLWGQNMQTNGAVRQAMSDFWHNRVITTSAGQIGVQDAFVSQATAAMTYIRQKLSAAQFQNILGLDPFNEPFDGGLEGKTGLEWEKTYLMPFYQRIRTAMDNAGWSAKPSFTEPLVWWNAFLSEQGGLSTSGPLGTRMVFNSHYYDGARLTLDPSAASNGTYDDAMNDIRERATLLGTAPIVSEFGGKMSGGGSDRTPWIIRAQYQAMDYGVSGSNWWTQPASGGNVLSSTMWHWDIYSGRHNELMNGNPNKVQTTGDGWNDEDHSVAAMTDSGTVYLRLDQRVLDRLYPSAIAGDTLAFAYEDLARSGYGGAGTQQQWLTAPSSLPTVSPLTSNKQYGVIVWRESASGGSTELHLPQAFTPSTTTVISDLGTTSGIPATGTIKTDLETGSTTARRLLITPTTSTPGTLHYALIINSGSTVTASQLTTARTELATWLTQEFS